MKKVILTGKQIALLMKVSSNTAGFYNDVESFLENNEELPEDESAELELEDDAREDLIEMITDYLGDDDLSGDDIPTEEEKAELRELLAQIEATEKADDDGDEEVEVEEEESDSEAAEEKTE